MGSASERTAVDDHHEIQLRKVPHKALIEAIQGLKFELRPRLLALIDEAAVHDSTPARD